jgi:hypothetical protein
LGKAFTIFSTGRFVLTAPVPVGKSAFEMKTRKVRPLGLWVVVEELLLPHETIVTPTAMSTRMLIKILFKPGTPKSMRDRDLDARKRIISERLRGIWRRMAGAGGVDAKAAILLYSEDNGL